MAACLPEGAADAVRTNLITNFNQPQAPDEAVAGGCATVTPSRIDPLSGQALLSAPPPSAIGDLPACEASGCEAIAQLVLLLRCAARTQAAVRRSAAAGTAAANHRPGLRRAGAR